MKLEIKIPAVGESINDGLLGRWIVSNGQKVELDTPLLEFETDKTNVEIAAPGAGVVEIKVAAGTQVKVGDVVGYVDAAGVATASAPAAKAAPSTVAASTKPAEAAGAKSGPAVLKQASEQNIDVSQLTGTGKDGRLVKADLQSAAAPATAAKAAPAAASVALPDASTRTVSRTLVDKRVPMTPIRKRIAERLLYSQQTTATLTTFNEIDMSAVMDLRNKYKDKFKEKHGIGLGFMSFFTKSVVEALYEFPQINGGLDGDDVVYKGDINIGVAVGTPKGLIVPVVRNADRLSLAEIEKAIAHYAAKARDGKIDLKDLDGGTFTVSNGGVYGSMMSTPILNPPQSGILGLHKIEERPVVVNKQIVIRPMMYVAFSYDHRLIDGSESVRFLVKIKECMEDPYRIFLEV